MTAKFYTVMIETPTLTKTLAVANEAMAQSLANKFRTYFMSGKSKCEFCHITIRNPFFRVIRKIHLHQN